VRSRAADPVRCRGPGALGEAVISSGRISVRSRSRPVAACSW
jgi:hypothetical protein